MKTQIVTLATAGLAALAGFTHAQDAADTPQAKLTLISSVNIFDGTSDKLHENMHVLIKDNLIEQISDEPLAIIQTDNVTMIDGRGRTLMPGLIDSHVHLTYSGTPHYDP